MPLILSKSSSKPLEIKPGFLTLALMSLELLMKMVQTRSPFLATEISTPLTSGLPISLRALSRSSLVIAPTSRSQDLLPSGKLRENSESRRELSPRMSALSILSLQSPMVSNLRPRSLASRKRRLPSIKLYSPSRCLLLVRT